MDGVRTVYSKVWFNTPRLAAAQRSQRLQKFGIKADGIINFLSNEPPFKQKRSLRYRRACPAEAHYTHLFIQYFKLNFGLISSRLFKGLRSGGGIAAEEICCGGTTCEKQQII
jgi:hypothetical protein